MSPLGVSVVTSEVPASGGVSTNTGTAFIAAPANYGPETTPTLIRSLNELTTLYGPRETGSSQLYDAANAFFSNEGARAYISRIAGEGSPAYAKLELETTSTTKVLVVTAKYKGTLGNSIKVALEEESSTTRLVIYNVEGEVVEKSPYFSKASELLAWGEEKSHQNYVLVTAGSSYSTGKTELVKKITATKLASGANPTTTEKAIIKTIEAIPKNLGPGQLLVPGNAGCTGLSETEKVHTAMGEHCQKYNRFAVCDLFEAELTGTSAATLVTNKGTPSNSISGYMSFYSSAVTAAGPSSAPTTSRTVAFSGVAAGLFAQVSRAGNNNRAPAGRNHSLAPFVTGIVNTYSEANMETLNNAGINNVAERFGINCLYGDRTAISPENDAIFYQYSAARERMQLVAEAEEIGERFLFATLDGRHQKRAKFQGELQGLIKAHWEAGALYGETAQEAGIVIVGEPVNTPASEAAGELKAELICRLSPVSEYVRLSIISKPITEAV